nr:protein AE7-like 1 [Cryptomonas curvata]
MLKKISCVTYGYKKEEIRFWIPASVFVLSLLKEIRDPEFPCYLLDLDVLSTEKIIIENHLLNQNICIAIVVAPTYNKCSMSTVIGLSIENILFNRITGTFFKFYFPQTWSWKSCVFIPSKFHIKGFMITKQLNDKERISAAIENRSIRNIIKFAYYKSIN